MDIDIEPGKTLPYDEERKAANYEKAYTMMANPVANPMLPEMLRIYEISNWRKLLAKYDAWRMYYQFVQLIEAVKGKKITPEQAIELLIQKAREYLASQEQTVEGIAARNMEKGEFDKKQLAIDRDRGKLEIEEAIFEIKKQSQKEKK